MVVFFFKQKTRYEMRISDWSSDVCSSDLRPVRRCEPVALCKQRALVADQLGQQAFDADQCGVVPGGIIFGNGGDGLVVIGAERRIAELLAASLQLGGQLRDQRGPRRIVADIALQQAKILHRDAPFLLVDATVALLQRSEEQTSELQSLMRISYSVFCFKTKRY